MNEPPTCGSGLAENAALPAKLGELVLAVGAILEAHIPSLDLTDEHSRKEHELYRRLVEDHRRAGVGLEAIARQMAGARDLPMGRHDEAAMAAPGVQRVFERFVELEQELLTLLQSRFEQDRLMLATMGAGR
jgi:hypothetical protein